MKGGGRYRQVNSNRLLQTNDHVESTDNSQEKILCFRDFNFIISLYKKVKTPRQ